MKFRPKLDAFRDMMGSRSGDGFVTPGNAITRAIYAPIDEDLGVDEPIRPAAAAPQAAPAAPAWGTTERTYFESELPLEPEIPIEVRVRRTTVPATVPAIIDSLGELESMPWTPSLPEPLPEGDLVVEAPVASSEELAATTAAEPAADDRAA